jgi:hypothetical protein
MAVKPANTYTASQVAALAKLKTTPLDRVNYEQAGRNSRNVTQGKTQKSYNVGQTDAQTRNVETLNKGYSANPKKYVSAAKNLKVDLSKVNPSAYAAEQKKLTAAPMRTAQQTNLLTKMQSKMNPPVSTRGYGANLPNIQAQKKSQADFASMRLAKGMAKGGVAASKMGAVKTASPSRDGIASKGKTKGTNLGNSGKNVGIMRGARRSK